MWASHLSLGAFLMVRSPLAPSASDHDASHWYVSCWAPLPETRRLEALGSTGKHVEKHGEEWRSTGTHEDAPAGRRCRRRGG